MYPLIYHKTLSVEKWSTFSKGKQLLMIANELNRAQNCINNHLTQETNLAYERAFELIALTVEDLKWKGKCKELLRCNEMLGELYISGEKDAIQNKMLMDNLIKLSVESYNMLNKK